MTLLRISDALSAERLDWAAYDALKGLLITLIVVGHGGIGSPGLLVVQNTLYNFHAPLFLLIAFLNPARPVTMRDIVKKARRYFVPLLWFSGAALVLFNLFFAGGRGIGEALLDYGQAWRTGSAFAFDRATGFEAFWFLHALFGLWLLRAVAARGQRAWQACVWAACAGVAFALLAFAPMERVREDVPTLLSLSAYCVAVAPFVFAVFNAVSRLRGPWLSLAVFAGVSVLFALGMVTYNIAHVRLPGLGEPLRLALWLLMLGAALDILVRLAGAAPVQRVFGALGRRSFEIFLIHLFVLFGVRQLLGAVVADTQTLPLVLFAASVALGLSFAAALALERIPALHRVLFPA